MKEFIGVVVVLLIVLTFDGASVNTANVVNNVGQVCTETSSKMERIIYNEYFPMSFIAKLKSHLVNEYGKKGIELVDFMPYRDEVKIIFHVNEAGRYGNTYSETVKYTEL